MRIIRNLYWLIKITLQTYFAHKEKGRFHGLVHSLSIETINKSREINDGSIPEKLFLKKQWYKVSTLFMGGLLANSIGEKLTEIEKKSLVYLGAVMGLCDVLVDDYKIKEEKMLSLISGKHIPDASPIEKVFQLYYSELLTIISDDKKKDFIEAFKTGIYWQIESLKQFSTSLTQNEVEQITLGKGGISIILCQKVLNQGENLQSEALMALGSFIQALNDAQDLYKDLKEGVTTFVSFQDSFESVLLELSLFKNRAFSLLEKQGQDASNQYFLFCFHSMYVAICFKTDEFSKVCGSKIDKENISQMDKQDFKISPYSIKSLLYCLPKILSFKFSKIA